MRIPFLLFCSLAGSLHAAVTFHPLFADRAVLQRDAPIPIFGSANPGEKVTVTFGKQKASAVADASGNWRIELPPAPASAEGQILEAQGQEGAPARAMDVLLGDVWLLGGQSNMRSSFKGYTLLKETTGTINDPQLRLLVINDPTKSSTPDGKLPQILPPYQGTWQPAATPWVDEFGPTGYYFGAALRRELGIPIGLVLSAVGGTPVERWIPPTDMQRAKPNAFLIETPSDLYNGMIAPLRGFGWRGVAWYQGESNSRDPLTYGALMRALIEGWRRELGVGEKPFIMCQIAPFIAREPKSTNESWAWLREQQAKVARALPKVGLVVTLDVGEGEDIHPQNKQPVGERIALFALREYGRTVQATSPRFLKQHVSGATLRLTFTETGGSLQTREVRMNRKPKLPFGTDPEAAVAPADRLVGFELCGKDGVYHSAEAEIHGNDVVLQSQSVPAPVSARYAWGNFPLGNLFGQTGLPAEPFRTDNLPPPDFGLPIEGVAAPDKSAGEPLVLIANNESTLGPVSKVDGRDAQPAQPAAKPNPKFRGRFLYAKLPDGFATGGKPVILSIVYHDSFRSPVRLRYDSSDPSVNPNSNRAGVFKVAGDFLMTGTGGWKAVEFTLPDGKFERRCNGGDIRLESGADRDLVIGGLYVRPAQ